VDGGHPFAPTREELEASIAGIPAAWANRFQLRDRAPSMVGEPRYAEWWARYVRMSASPGAAQALMRMNAEIDVRPVPSTIRVPTLVAHHVAVRAELNRFRGREVDTAGDGFLATFDGPARGIRAACAIASAVRRLGIDIRAGLHTGECEIQGAKLSGVALHIGARVAGLAGPGEVLVSQTVKDLVAGSGLRFAERGAHALKGVPGQWRLYAVDRTAAVA
jgi:hypothetical protein